MSKPRIAVFAGATATILNTMPLVTSNKARDKYRLPLLKDPQGGMPRFDILRPQRLAKSVTVLVEAYSAHPLEADSSSLYAEPDGYLDADGNLHRSRQNTSDVPVFEITLEPADGLYPLPYMARQANGEAWEGDGAYRGAPPELTRQPFFPDASRLFEEIDRMGIGDEGVGNLLASRADFDFFRVAPPGGYTRRDGSAEREGAPAEVLGQDYFPYRPGHLRREPRLSVLAKVTNDVQRAMASGKYIGGIWLEGSPFVEETAYWLNLLIDTTAPIVGNASHRPHGAASNDGDRNVIDAVDYICSGIWADRRGRNEAGVVMIQDEVIMTSREVQKADARPGGYVTTGGHGGIIGSMGQPGPALMTFLPVRRHTHSSAVATLRLPEGVRGVRRDSSNGRVIPTDVTIKDANGDLIPASIPWVSIVKHARYSPPDSDEPGDVEVESRVEANLGHSPLAGFVAEGAAPYGSMSTSTLAALHRATMCGMPVVHVGRGNPGGFVPPERFDLAVAGSNLTATKARLLLMACMLRFGALPPARDPDHPRPAEIKAIRRQIERYQRVFDTH